jgi:hypothetical protein
MTADRWCDHDAWQHPTDVPCLVALSEFSDAIGDYPDATVFTAVRREAVRGIA